jgi:hypothetical protein
MTTGILVSRRHKIELLKRNLKERSNKSKTEYIAYRNIYNRVLRKSKQLYYMEQINSNSKNSKKLWSVLKEVSTGKCEQVSIDKIIVNNTITTDKSEISNGFNEFFSTIGSKISESVQPVDKLPESFIPDAVNIPLLDLGNTVPSQIVDIVKALDSKQSCDIDGISLKLLKYIAYEISRPLSHIF